MGSVSGVDARATQAADEMGHISPEHIEILIDSMEADDDSRLTQPSKSSNASASTSARRI